MFDKNKKKINPLSSNINARAEKRKKASPAPSGPSFSALQIFKSLRQEGDIEYLDIKTERNYQIPSRKCLLSTFTISGLKQEKTTK